MEIITGDRKILIDDEAILFVESHNDEIISYFAEKKNIWSRTIWHRQVTGFATAAKRDIVYDEIKRQRFSTQV